MRNDNFFKSFYHAANGIRAACLRERNLRFHIVVANLICVFAYFFGLERIEWALLFLVIAVVISAELVNTAVENAVDTATMEIRPTARLAKDAAAGAVLLAAISAVAIGICIFGDVDMIIHTLKNIVTNAKSLAVCILIGCADIWFLHAFKIKEN